VVSSMFRPLLRRCVVPVTATMGIFAPNQAASAPSYVSDAPSADVLRMDSEKLKAAVKLIFRKGGSTPEEAAHIAHLLVLANLKGHDSHGIGYVPRYIKALQDGCLFPNTLPRLVKHDGPIMVFDGQRGYGQIVATRVMEAAIQQCQESGVAIAALGGSHHVGRIGYYGEMAASRGLVSIHFVNVVDHSPLVAPFGGRDARYGTNPICVAIPADNEAGTKDIILDFATSITALGKVREAFNQGKSVPEGWVMDKDGEPSTDPAVMFPKHGDPQGAQVPFGLHKGYGLAVICELLAGALCGYGTLQPVNPQHDSIVNSMLTIIIDPKRLGDIAFINNEITEYVKYVKQSPTGDADPVLVAGERAARTMENRLADGIPIPKGTWAAVTTAAEKLGITKAELDAVAQPRTEM